MSTITPEEKHIRTAGTGTKATETKKFSLLVSVALNVVILLVILHFTDVFYETNDDYAIAERIANDYPYIGFVNYYLCKVLIVIQNIFGDVNIFILSQIVMSFLSFTVLLKVMLDREKCFSEMILSVAVITVFSLDHYSSIQFTKTAALLMTAGLVLLVDTYIHERRIIPFFIAFLLFYIGVGYRQKGMFPALAFAGVFMLIWYVLNRKEFFARDRRWTKEISLVVLVAVLALIPYGLDILSDRANESTPELKAAREYSAERVRITDYPAYEYYEDNRIAYEKAGLSENDIYMLDRWIFDYDGAASYDNLIKINEINYPQVVARRSIEKAVKKFLRKSYAAVENRTFTGIHIILLIALSICTLIVVKPRNWTYMLLMGFLTVVLYVSIYFLQRAQYRAFYVADVSAAFWIMYAMIIADRRERPVGITVRNIACIMAAAAALVLLVPGVNNLVEHRNNIDGLIESAEVAEYFADNPDKIFIGPTTIMSVHRSYLDPFSIPEPERNVTDTGGWETMTPYKLDALRENGIDNPVRDLIDNSDALFFGDYFKGNLKEYYNKWYGSQDKEIIFEKVDEVDGNGIYRIVTTLK